MLLADLVQARLRVRLLQGPEERLGLPLGRLDFEHLAAAAEGALVVDVDVADALRGGHLPDLRLVHVLPVLDGDHVAPREVDPVDPSALEDGEAEAEEGDQPSRAERREAVLHEVEVDRRDQPAHRDLLHGAGVDQELHDQVHRDQDREHRREDADRERDAEAADGAGAEPDHDRADQQLHDVRVDDRHQRLR